MLKRWDKPRAGGDLLHNVQPLAHGQAARDGVRDHAVHAVRRARDLPGAQGPPRRGLRADHQGAAALGDRLGLGFGLTPNACVDQAFKDHQGAAARDSNSPGFGYASRVRSTGPIACSITGVCYRQATCKCVVRLFGYTPCSSSACLKVNPCH